METVLDKLKVFFAGKPEVSMAFLFGSVAKGKETGESDIDVAVWLKSHSSLPEIDKLWGEIEALLHHQIDLVVLNQARPTVAWAAMRGKPLIIRDYRLYLSKMLDFSREAEDFQDFVFDFWNWRKKLGGTFA